MCVDEYLTSEGKEIDSVEIKEWREEVKVEKGRKSVGGEYTLYS